MTALRHHGTTKPVTSWLHGPIYAMDKRDATPYAPSWMRLWGHWKTCARGTRPSRKTNGIQPAKPSPASRENDMETKLLTEAEALAGKETP
jgi:hypothetical protein